MISKLRIAGYWFILMLFLTGVSCSDKTVENNRSVFEWEVVTPESQGMNSELLNELSNKIMNKDYAQITSLLIIRNDKIVFERYYDGTNMDTKHNVYSVTKSFTSALIGIALRDKKINSVEDKVYDYFPEYENIQNPSPLKDSMTIEHVLQMKSGMEWDELSIPYMQPGNSFTSMYQSDDVVKFALDQPVMDTPGTKFTYNTGLSMILGGVLRNQYNENVDVIAKRELFDKIGIDDFDWVQVHNGFIPTGNGLTITPRDMARFGLLYLHNGVWMGEAVIPSSWVEKSFQKYSEFSTGNGYGYHWWMRKHKINNKDVIIPEALGYGNQYIYPIKELDMVVVSTARNYDNFTYHMNEILDEYIFPAVTGN